MKDPDTMTDGELNIAVCKWRGWTDIHEHNFAGIEALGNLAEARRGLTKEQKDQYLRELQIAVDDTIEGGWLWAVVNATPRQRAIALLRVVRQQP